MIYEQFGELKYKYRNRSFWCRGYYVDTVGKNDLRIAEYIKHQLDEDKLGDQLKFAEVGYLEKRKRNRSKTQMADHFTCCTRCEEEGLCPLEKNPTFYVGL